MGPAKSQQRKRGPVRAEIARNLPPAQDWLRAAKRAMCVSLGQQIARLEEDHI